jgi:hypothetical protein
MPVTTTSTTSTSTTTTTTKRNVVFNIFDGSKIVNTSTLNYQLNSINKGIVSTQCGVACPNCENIYFFGNNVAYSSFVSVEFPNLQPSENLPCCGRTAGIQTPLDNGFTGTCNTNFSPCLQILQDALGPTFYELLLNQGIIEYTSVNNISIICQLIIEAQNSPIYTPQLLYIIFNYILSQGLVITCDGKFSIIGTVPSYATYANRFMTTTTTTINSLSGGSSGGSYEGFGIGLDLLEEDIIY